MIWVWAFLYVAAGVACVTGWYLWAIKAQQNRAIKILHWIEGSLSGKGHVTGLNWTSPSDFEVPLRLFHAGFQKAAIRVSLNPIHWPLVWMWKRFRQTHEESLTFQADLDLRPTYNLQVRNMRWFARSRKNLDPSSRNWRFAAGDPVVLTTRKDWTKELAATLQSVVCCEERDQLQLRFQKNSPHFSATLPLESISPDSDEQVKFYDVLHAIADSASRLAS